MQGIVLKLVERLLGWRVAFALVCKVSSYHMIKPPSSLLYLALRRFLKALRIPMPRGIFLRGDHDSRNEIGKNQAREGLKIYVAPYWNKNQIKYTDEYFKKLGVRHAYIVVDSSQVEHLVKTKAKVVSVTDVWTDHSSDLAVHSALNNYYSEISRKFSNVNAAGVEFFPLTRILFSQFFILVHRFEQMFDLVCATDVNAVVVCQSPSFSVPLLMNIIENQFPVHTLHFSGIRGMPQVNAVRRWSRSGQRLRLINKWLNNGLENQITSPESISGFKSKVSKSKEVLIVTDSLYPGRYWEANRDVCCEIKRKGGEVRILTSDVRIKIPARAQGWKVFMPGASVSSLLSLSSASIKKYYDVADEYLEEVTAVERDPPSLFNKRRIIARWLSDRDRVPDLITTQLIAQQVRALLVGEGVQSIFVLPHWAHVPNIVAIEARSLDLKVVSAPLVSVAANEASIVGWDHVSAIGCYGSQCLDAFEKVGVGSERLILTGNISLDRLINRSENVSVENLTQVIEDIEIQKSIILVATSRIDLKENIWIDRLARFCESRGDCRVILKPHPSFSDDAYSGLRDRYDPSVLRIVRDANIYDLIVSAKVCVTDYSTVGAEAVVAGKPLVVVNLTGQPYPANDYVGLGVAYGVTDLADITPTFSKVIDAPALSKEEERNIERFVHSYNYLNDGRAAERVANILLN